MPGVECNNWASSRSVKWISNQTTQRRVRRGVNSHRAYFKDHWPQPDICFHSRYCLTHNAAIRDNAPIRDAVCHGALQYVVSLIFNAPGMSLAHCWLRRVYVHVKVVDKLRVTCVEEKLLPNRQSAATINVLPTQRGICANPGCIETIISQQERQLLQRTASTTYSPTIHCTHSLYLRCSALLASACWFFL